MEPTEKEQTQRERRLLLMLTRLPNVNGRFDDRDNLIVSCGTNEYPVTPEQQERLVSVQQLNTAVGRNRLALIDSSGTETEFGNFRQGLVFSRARTIRMWVLQPKLVPDKYWRLPRKRDPKLALQQLAAAEFERKADALS